MTTPLHALLNHVEGQRDSAQTALSQAEAQVTRLQQQAVQLQSYQHDYRLRHPAQGGRSASMALLDCHSGFMQRLTQALSQQQGQVQHARARISPLQQTLLSHEMRLAGIKKLMQRRDQGDLRQAARLDQKRTDEAAQRGANSARAAGPHGSPHGRSAGWRLGSEMMPL